MLVLAAAVTSLSFASVARASTVPAADIRVTPHQGGGWDVEFMNVPIGGTDISFILHDQDPLNLKNMTFFPPVGTTAVGSPAVGPAGGNTQDYNCGEDFTSEASTGHEVDVIVKTVNEPSVVAASWSTPEPGTITVSAMMLFPLYRSVVQQFRKKMVKLSGRPNG
jgi:hypothetical protein